MVEEQRIVSRKTAVRYRGWFFNDETFLSRWNPGGDETLAWEMGFEACLRCGGNMVIPGDVDNFRKYRKLASDMGLILTHHHVEILGAPMFLNVYPEENPSYRETALCLKNAVGGRGQRTGGRADRLCGGVSRAGGLRVLGV